MYHPGADFYMPDTNDEDEAIARCKREPVAYVLRAPPFTQPKELASGVIRAARATQWTFEPGQRRPPVLSQTTRYAPSLAKVGQKWWKFE